MLNPCVNALVTIGRLVSEFKLGFLLFIISCHFFLISGFPKLGACGNISFGFNFLISFAKHFNLIGVPSSSRAIPIVALIFLVLASFACAKIPFFGKKIPFPLPESNSDVALLCFRMISLSSIACGFAFAILLGHEVYL